MAEASNDQFLLIFPLWFLVNPAVKGRAFVEVSAGQIRATPLFTDRDLAERYRDSIPGTRENYRLGTIPEPPILLQFLDGYQRLGFTHIAVDPYLKRSHFQEIVTLKERIRAALDSL